MPNEIDNLVPQGEVQQADQTPAPTTLEEAMRALRSNNTPAPTGDVDTQRVEQEGDNEPGATTGNQEGEAGSGEIAQVPNAENGNVGGPAAPDAAANMGAGLSGEPGSTAESSQYTQQDYDDIQKRIINSVTQQAAAKADEVFREQGIRLWNINDLYERDESGRVSFRDPENPGGTFASRYEAQQWIEAMNKQVNDAWQQEARKYQREFYKQTQPALRLMQFAPVYDSMSEQTKAVFDTIVEPYEVKDSTGAAIGFSCDLNAAKAQAEKIVQSFGGITQAPAAADNTAAQPPASTGPALDAVTSGSTGSGADMQPKNLSDAFKMLNQKNKENREKGKK